MKSYSMRFGSGDPRTYTGLAPTFLIFVRASDGQTIAPPGITERLTGSGLYQFDWGTTQPIAFLADAATTTPGTTGRYVSGSIDPADRADEYGNTLIAIGTSNIALGTTSIALGTTAVALGTTAVALGTTNVALGITAVSYDAAQGLSTFALGVTSVALGTSSVALGTSIYALEQTLGTTVVAIGNTSIALGNTNLAIAGIGGTLSVTIGSTSSLIGDSSTDPTTLFGYLKRLGELYQGQQQYVKSTGVLTMLDRTGATTLATRTIANNASLVAKS